MANKDDSFLSKHGDKINAAGHAINTLQNAQIAERQRKIAQLQVATANLQQEENELKKKELQLLEKQQRALEEEQRRARQEQKEKEDLKAELLDVAPRLTRMLDEIVQTEYSNTFDRGKDLYEASSALAYLNEHKGVIDDINFHEYLFQINEKLNKPIIKFQSDFDSFNSYLEEFYIFLVKHSLYFEVIELLLGGKKVNIRSKADIEQYEKGINELSSNEELLMNLIESLKEYEQKILRKDFKLDSRFVVAPLQKNEYKIILNFLESVKSSEDNHEIIDHRFREIKTNFKFNQCLEYLTVKFTHPKVSEIKNKLKSINLNLINTDDEKRLKRELNRYVQSVKDSIRESLRQYPSDIDVESFKMDIKKVDSMTGLKSDNLINEINELDGKINRRRELGGLATVLSVVSEFFLFLLTHDKVVSLFSAFLSFIFLFTGFFSFLYFLKPRPADKYIELARHYTSEVKEALKPLENWGK